MKRTLPLMLLIAAACLALSGSIRAAKGGGNSQNFLVRAQFRDDPSDGVRSDGKYLFTCDDNGYDYIDNHDTCDEGDVKTASYLRIERYFLRTPGTDKPDPTTRWLVLDFGVDVTNPPCPDLDNTIPGSPPPVSGCVDNVFARFLAEPVFSDAASSGVSIKIDGREVVKTKGGTETRWNPRYTLDFVNPLTVTPVVGQIDTVTIGEPSDDFQAELWSMTSTGRKQTFFGIFNMPFRVTIKKTDQFLPF